MEIPTIPGLILVAVLLLINALFVATEFAYVTVRRTRVNQLASEGNTAARTARRALGNLDYYVAASQLGITMASIALGWFGEPVLAHLIEPPVEALVGSFAPAFAHTIAIGTAFAIITVLHVIVGEFIPKTIALERPEATTLSVAVPIEIFARVFGPVIWLLNTTGNTLLRMAGMNLRAIGEEPLSAEDLAYTLETSESAGLISRRELDLARSTLRLTTMDAGDLMVPRTDIVGIPSSADRDEVLEILATDHHTRYPVYRDSLDHIVGIVDVKSILIADGADWRQHIQPPVVLPENVSAERALEVARDAGTELVVLIDEYGGTAGIMSIFDIAEYMAGHLPDEYHVEPPNIERNPDGTITVRSLARVSDLEEELGIHVPDIESDTAGGMAMAVLDRLPQAGDEFVIDGYLVHINEMNGRRVESMVFIPHSDDGSGSVEEQS